MDPIYLMAKYAICYGIFFLLVFISNLDDGNKPSGKDGPVRSPRLLIGLYIAGILWLGSIPFAILNHSLKDIVFGNSWPDREKWLGFSGASAVTLLIVYLEIKKEERLTKRKNNPVMLSGSSFLYKYVIVRVIFLFVYEAWFRGYLLIDSVGLWGIQPAIFINITLEALLKRFNSRKEMLACIPFGMMLCVMSNWFGSAWPAIALHIAVALIYETRLVKKAFYPLKGYRISYY